MPGPSLGREGVESVADAGGEAVEVVAVRARQEGVGGQRRAESVCVAGMGPGAGRPPLPPGLAEQADLLLALARY